MGKKVLVISTSLRADSNSGTLAREVLRGAQEAGHQAAYLDLKGRDIRFCIGCLTCYQTHRCVLRDDVPAIMEQVRQADTLVFVTPIYYHNISGQMKVLLDRLNPLYKMDYRFRSVYLLTVSAEGDPHVAEPAAASMRGWTDCFRESRLAGTLHFGGDYEGGAVKTRPEQLQAAFAFGRALE